MASYVAIQQGRMLKITFTALILYYFYDYLDAAEQVLDDSLLCRHCGHEVASVQHIINIPSPESTHQRNDTSFGAKDVLIQKFVNPYGKIFEVITTRKADILKGDESVASATFFPGFAWRICVCPRCGFQLGWFFQPFGHTKDKKDTPDTFVGLILRNLLHKAYADNLVIAPKFRDS